MLFRSIFVPFEERPVSIRPLSLYASEMFAMQKTLLEKSAAELLRTDLFYNALRQKIPAGNIIHCEDKIV